MGAELKLYRVEVKRQGCTIAEFTVPAATALTAIEQVERFYGDPASVEHATIEDSHSRQHDVMLVHHWHGYMFHAKAIASTPTSSEGQTILPSAVGLMLPA
jgi:hypothetical protein